MQINEVVGYFHKIKFPKYCFFKQYALKILFKNIVLVLCAAEIFFMVVQSVVQFVVQFVVQSSIFLKVVYHLKWLFLLHSHKIKSLFHCFITFKINSGCACTPKITNMVVFYLRNF